MPNGEKTVELPFSVYTQIKAIYASRPEVPHLFIWGKGHLLLIGQEIQEYLPSGAADVVYLQEYKRIKTLARSVGSITHILNEDIRHRGIGRYSARDRQWEEGPRYQFTRKGWKKLPIASDRITRQLYYYRVMCNNCGRMFY